MGLVGFTLLLSSCGGKSSDTPAASQPPPQEKQAEGKAMDKGHVVHKQNGQLLITKYIQKDEHPYIDAVVFKLNAETILQDSSGQSIKEEELREGMVVDAWHTGYVQESYPSSTTASKIVVHKEGQAGGEGRIGSAAALEAVLRSSSQEQVLARAVKKAELDAENGIWSIELLVQDFTGQSEQKYRVDARSGSIIPEVVAENGTFRVFSPAPGTEAGPVFTVEGQARAFEAAFSWQLEDGHNILAEGHEMADQGAPEWGSFKFDVSYKTASQPNMMLILFVHSAKDGSVANELIVPLKAPASQIQYMTQ
jgi:hypothetical protein